MRCVQILAQIKLSGNFKDLEKSSNPRVFLTDENERYNCKLDHMTETMLICSTKVNTQSIFDVEITHMEENELGCPHKIF